MESTIMLPDLENPSKFKMIPGVAILDEETEGDPDFDWLTSEFLHNVVDNTNSKVDQGELLLMTIGHTDKNLPETEQPPGCGYAKNLQIGDHFGKEVILADLYYKVEMFDEAMTYPRRSVEVYPNKDYIDIVSLLRRKPARHLGLITCKSDGEKTRYSKPIGDLMTLKDIDFDKLAVKLSESLSQSLRAFLADDDEPKKDEDDDKKENADSSPQGSNVMIPSELEEEKKDNSDDDEEKKDTEDEDEKKDNEDDSDDDEKESLRLRSDDNAIRLSHVESENLKLRAELKSVKDQVQTLKAEKTKAVRERQLKQLQAEGFQFSMEQELPDTLQLSDQAFEKHLIRVKSNYKRLPIGRTFIETQEPYTDQKTLASKDDVVSFATKRGIYNYEQAKAAFAKENK